MKKVSLPTILNFLKEIKICNIMEYQWPNTAIQYFLMSSLFFLSALSNIMIFS